MPSTEAISIVIAALVLAPSLARADAISGPPACPPGAEGRSSHSGEWCEASPCTSDADCAASGAHCRTWRVCTQAATIPVGGLGQFRHPPPPPDQVDEVVGSCDPARACLGDEEPPPPTAGTLASGAPHCTVATFCVPDPLPSLPWIDAPPAPVAPPTSIAPPTTIAPAAAAPEASASCGCVTAGLARTRGPWLLLALLGLALAARRR